VTCHDISESMAHLGLIFRIAQIVVRNAGRITIGESGRVTRVTSHAKTSIAWDLQAGLELRVFLAGVGRNTLDWKRSKSGL